ncbi:hypothetical protein KSP39_PZI000928 [Platanthera zijinensis]|uniref:Uncharacterized protein n=1 Tax=Platanthera zijinensis TaxID=2320716 RepID=A0AAP0C209_9ASPA
MVGFKQYKPEEISDAEKSKKNMHTTDRTSFACVRNELQKVDANKEPPTAVQMFTETRKRVVTREYKKSFEYTQRKIVIMLVILHKPLVFALLITKMYKF